MFPKALSIYQETSFDRHSAKFSSVVNLQTCNTDTSPRKIVALPTSLQI